MNNEKRWVLDVKEDENGNAILEFPEDFLQSTGWKEGDTIRWINRGDGSWLMKKNNTQYVLVECVSQYRMRYVVEVPLGVDEYGRPKSEWALDTVTMEEAKEFSQEHLGETIFSHRVISYDDVLKLCDKDNDYASAWSDEKKLETFVTEWKNNDQSMGSGSDDQWNIN